VSVESGRVHVVLELSDGQAFAFAQFLKRSTFEDYRGRAASVEEAYAMIAACEAIRQALAEAGYAPR
jgi:hypothetical protein